MGPCREKKMARSGALKTLSYAMNGAEGASVANRYEARRVHFVGILRASADVFGRLVNGVQICRRARAAGVLPSTDGQGPLARQWINGAHTEPLVLTQTLLPSLTPPRAPAS